MPIIVTFDLSNAKDLDLHRVRSLFERFGWEHLGGTAYRYPRLEDEHSNEDWFNRVIPALMLLRALALAEGRGLTRFSIDVQTSTGYNSTTGIGQPPLC